MEQGLQAFQAAQLHGIKSRLIVMQDENHWVLHPQNALVWQQEFFKWLRRRCEEVAVAVAVSVKTDLRSS